MLRSVALLLEDLGQAGLSRLHRRRGRVVRVQPFPGLATPGRTRVGGRVLLVTPTPTAPGPRSATRSALRSNLAQFLTVEVPRARVRVDLAGHTVTVTADREGYVQAVLDVALPPGPHPATLTPVDPAGEAAPVTVHALDPAADLAIVSDIDDTIIDSGIARGVLATITTALLRDAATRVPLEGAVELYRALAGGGTGPVRPFVYLSTSPWNLVAFLQRFLTAHGFPEGPLLLTDWGPGAGRLLRVRTRDHKLTALRDLATALPGPRLVLVGDSGQEDPEIYTAFAREHPDRVAVVYIRHAGVHGPATRARLDALRRTLDALGIPLVSADDSATMLAHAVATGLATGPAPGGAVPA